MDTEAPPIAQRETAPLTPPITEMPPRRGPGWRALALLGLIAFAAGLAAMAVVVRYYHHGVVEPVASSVAVQPVTTTAGTSRTPVPSAPAPDALDALAIRENELTARLAALEVRAATVANDAQAASGNAGRAEALLVTFAARRAIDRGQPLGYIEEQLRVRFGTSQPAATGAVLQAARSPVTLEDLRAGLDGVSPVLVTGAASDGWLVSLRREFGSLVTIRRATTPSASPTDRMTRARRLLEAGEVEAALAEVARMPGAASATAWTNAARRYIGTRQALDRLEAAAIGGQAAPTHA